MRVGINPTRMASTDYRPARVTVCVLTFVPEQVGYFARRFDVMKLCLHSLLENTDKPYDLLVLDNGSCGEVVEYLRRLRDQGAITYLILCSRNIGINGGQRIMFNAAPGEVIAYSQDDVCFDPGWLPASLEILDTFPRVGLVSGIAVREQFRYGNRYLPAYLSDYPEISVKRGHFIPDAWETEFHESLGRDGTSWANDTRAAYEDIVLEHRGVKAYSTAVHFQYTARKPIALEGLGTSWDRRLMIGPDLEMDERIDGLGYARLSTFQRFVRHMGNAVTPALAQAVAGGVPQGVKTWSPPEAWAQSLIRRKPINGILRRIYNWSYFLLTYAPDKWQRSR
jgi:hypothetical protein